MLLGEAENMSKIAFVTGSSRVTGKNIALELARAGYDVGITYTGYKEGADDAVKQIEAMGQRSKAYYLDTRDIEGCRKTIDEFCEEFGGIDVMVNNTGLTIFSNFLETEPDVFAKLFETNLRGCYFCGQAAARQMVKRGIKGVIVNLSSVHAQGTWPGDSLYAVSKAAISRLTQAEALDLAPYGIRAVAVAPGYIDTGWQNRSDEAHAKYEQALRRIPLKRFAEGAEIGKAVVFLASENAGYITGTTLFVEGGALLPVITENDYGPGVGSKEY